MRKEEYKVERVQAEGMEKFTGIYLTPLMVALYQVCRQQSSLSDQELLAKIIELDKGDVETFKKAYPQIFCKEDKKGVI